MSISRRQFIISAGSVAGTASLGLATSAVSLKVINSLAQKRLEDEGYNKAEIDSALAKKTIPLLSISTLAGAVAGLFNRKSFGVMVDQIQALLAEKNEPNGPD